MVKRNMIHTKRMPEMLSDVTVQPIMFVLLFAFVFGASIATRGGASYREFLLPGIQAQTIVFTAFVVSTGITADIEKGIIDRFRSLPIRRSAVLIGRSVASLLHSSIGVVVMAVTGLCIGWRIRGGVAEAVLAFGLILVFGFGMIWFGILIGSLMRSVEAVNGVMFTVLFPITFLANTFAPTEPMPHWLRVIAEWNPVSSLAQAMRELWGNGPAAPPDAQLPLHHPVLATILWSLALTAIIRAVRIARLRASHRELARPPSARLQPRRPALALPLLECHFAGHWSAGREELAPGVHGVLGGLQPLRDQQFGGVGGLLAERRTSGRSAAVKFSSTNDAPILAAGRAADADAHPLKVVGAQRRRHRPQAVVAGHAAAELQPDAAEVDVELVVDDHDVGGRHRVELRQRPDLAARLVHVASAAWPAPPAGRRACPVTTSAPDFLCTLNVEPDALGQQVGDDEAEVVPGRGVVGPGIAQAHHQ